MKIITEIRTDCRGAEDQHMNFHSPTCTIRMTARTHYIIAAQVRKMGVACKRGISQMHIHLSHSSVFFLNNINEEDMLYKR